jgi:GntR family transcriptional regulator, transcriptional repressor for pyruvate dehydrogenase complex
MSLGFHPIDRPSSLTQVIVESIERSILEKKLVPGQKLPTEADLCVMFSVSRTAVREALRTLSARGVITVRKRTGIFVNDLSTGAIDSSLRLYLNLTFEKEHLLHVFNIRQVFEPEVARWAAAERTNEDLQLLELNLGAMEHTDPSDRANESKLDQDFHMAIATASRNPVVPLVLQPVFTLMPRIRELVYANIPHCESSALQYHRKIADAIRRQDGYAAFAAMQTHIGLARKQAGEVLGMLGGSVPKQAVRRRNHRRRSSDRLNP